MVESACQNGRLLNCSVWGGASCEAVERPQPDRCLHRLDDPGRGAFFRHVPPIFLLFQVCDDKMFLESLVSHSSLLLSPKCQAALEALGDRGRLLLVKCVGSATGLTLLQSNSWLQVITGI